MEHEGKVVSFHRLNTRKIGNQRHIDIHLVLPKDNSVEEVHQMCDGLERAIANKLPHDNVTIHVEPCDEECDQCPVTCTAKNGND